MPKLNYELGFIQLHSACPWQYSIQPPLLSLSFFLWLHCSKSGNLIPTFYLLLVKVNLFLLLVYPQKSSSGSVVCFYLPKASFLGPRVRSSWIQVSCGIPMRACGLPDLRARGKSTPGVSPLIPDSIQRIQTLLSLFTHANRIYPWPLQSWETMEKCCFTMSTQKLYAQPPSLLFHYFQNPRVPELMVSCFSWAMLLLTPHSLALTPISG